jgi:hypothetical protein
MSEKRVGGVHWSFWVIGVVALIWNAAGSINFLAQMNADTVASMPEAYQAVIGGRPFWATGAFGIGVFGGTLGCVLLLLRRWAAYYLFTASLLGVAVTTIDALGGAPSGIDFTPVYLGTSSSLVVAGLLVLYSQWAKKKGWVGSAGG